MISRWKFFCGTLALCFVALGTDSRSAEQTLVAPGSSWKYNDSGLNLGTAWRAVAYNDASWPSGPAQLGYGDGGEATVLSYGSNASNKRITYYFRRSFSVTNPASIAALTVRFVRDDGLLIYLNGTEVVRSNMPTGTIGYTTRATTAISGADESAWQQAAIDPSRLVAGTNVLAVELHQQSPSSTDISFDVELKATEAQAPAPVVSLISPTNHGISNTPDVTFSASISATAGLASATLYVGGAPKTLLFTGPSQVEDAQVTGDTPTIADPGGAAINVDGQSPHAHALVKVPALIGAGSGQVPPGAVITSAMLQVNCTNAGNVMNLYRLTESWVENEATWNERSIGLPWGSAGADGAGSNAGVALTGDCTATGPRLLDITLFVQQWANGALNHGMVLTDSGTDGIDFDSSESANPPVLTVTYKASQQAIETQPVSGTSAQVSFTTTLTIGQTYYWNIQAADTTGGQSSAPSDFDLTVDASSPDEPVLVSPANAATGVVTSPALSAFVGDPASGTLNVSVGLRKAAAPEFTIIALPDTQHYSEAFPAVFTSQTQWIVDNKNARNIVFVTHEGDIVEHNNLPSEWQAANTSLTRLDGVVPYGMGPGNHDQPTTLYNQFFPYTRYQNETWYGGHFQNLNDNNFQLFSGGGMDFVIVHLEFCPPAAAVTWASSVFQTYPDRIGMVTTHGYLNESAQRSVNLCSNTQYLWDGLAVPNPNIHFMLAGHVHAESRRSDTANGHPVHQMLADYQDRATGGEGWLRILRFVPAEARVYVQTYSPWLNRFETDADSQFTLDFPMGGAFSNAGTTVAASGSTASITPAALEPFTEYEWQMTVTNSSGKTRTGQVWRFTTGAGGSTNQPPSATDQSVSLVEDSTSTFITLAAVDPDGGALTYSVASGPLHGTLSGIAPALMYQPAPNYNGPDSFTFRASDGQANSNVATVSIAVQAVNDPPLANGESHTVQAGDTLTVSAPGLLNNDSDVDGGTLTAQLVSVPTHGALALSADGSFTYTPETGYSGPDSFTYLVNDGQADSGVATVSLAVTPSAPPPVLVPNVVTQTQAAATAALTGAGLVVGTISTASHATIPSGSVISQTPTAGTGVAPGSAVALVISTGPPLALVPNVVTQTQAAATTAITGAGLVVGTISTASHATIPSGSVISQTPTAGTSVAVGSAVALVISTGPPLVLVPNVANQTQAAATTAITGAGLVLGTISTASHGTIPSGSVISQTPTAGSSVALGSAVALVVSTGPAGADPSLVAAYGFNEGSGTAVRDGSGTANHGTISGTGTWTSAGKYGGALRFNGTNTLVTVPNSASLALTTGMTVEAWVMPAATPTGWRTVLHKNVDRFYLFVSSATSNRPAVGGTFGSGNQNTIGPSTLAVNVWTHLAGTFDGTTVRLYVNGVLVASQTQTTPLTTSTGTLQMGGSGYGEYFNGWLDNIRIYNRALTAAEIQADMAAPVNP